MPSTTICLGTFTFWTLVVELYIKLDLLYEILSYLFVKLSIKSDLGWFTCVGEFLETLQTLTPSLLKRLLPHEYISPSFVIAIL